MLTEYEKDALVAFFIRGERVLDFAAEGFMAFAEGELMRPMPLKTDMDGCVTGDVCSYLCEIIERDGGLLSYPERISLLRMLLLRYEAVVASGGLAAERLRNDIGHHVCKTILDREAAQVLKPLPPVEKALPRVPALPTARMTAAKYYSRLWRRTNALSHVWGEVSPDSLGTLDFLCHGFDTALLDVARAFDALSVVREALSRKCREDASARVAPLFMRASPVRRCIDRLVKAELSLLQDETPEWLIQAVDRFNGEFLDVLCQFAASLGVGTYMPFVDAFAACVEFWEVRSSQFTNRGKEVPRTFEYDYHFVVSRYLRYADLFAWDLNFRECARHRVVIAAEGEDGFCALIRHRFEAEERLRERTAQEHCSHLLRRVKGKLNNSSMTLTDVLTRAMRAQPGDPLYPISLRLRQYRDGFRWSDDTFRRICLTTPRRKCARHRQMSAEETLSAFVA